MSSSASYESEEYEIESARFVVFLSFIAQRSLTPLDLNACEYMNLRKSIFTEEGYKKMHHPGRRILDRLHLDLPRNSERSLRIASPHESNREMTFHLGVTRVCDWVYNHDLEPSIVNNIRLADNKAEKLRRYLNIVKLLKFDRDSVNFFFESLIQVLYPDCMDSELVVEFAETFSFYSWIFYRETPDIVGYVLEHARRMRYNILESAEGRLDPINACIAFHTTGNIGKLLEYGTVLRTQCHIYMEILGEFLGVRRQQCNNAERRIFLLIQLLYIFMYNNTSWAELRFIWRSIPDPYLSANEIYFAFGAAIPLEYFYALKDYYTFVVVESNTQIDHVYPRSLLHLCRIAIRGILSRNFQLPHAIDQLGISNILKSYLKLEN